MNSNFTFPPRAPPSLRTDTEKPGDMERPPSTSADAASRDSNLVRASILDAAMDLGFGSNATVAKWMFENQLEEEEEEAISSPVAVNSPASEDSTSASAGAFTTPSTSLSDHSYAMFPRSADTFHPRPMAQDPPRLPSMAESESAPNNVTFAPAVPPNKLRKKARGDGYESDGGYVSEAGRRRKASTKSSDKKEAREAKKELREAKKEERKKKAAPKADDSGYHTGYETDRASTATRKSGKSLKSKKSKQKVADAGYETDDGYISAGGSLKPKKSRFFKLGKNKEPMPQPQPQVMTPEPVRPPMPLPIAQRFATTLQDSVASRQDPDDSLSIQASTLSQATMVQSSRAGSSGASTLSSTATPNESWHLANTASSHTTEESAAQQSLADNAPVHALASKDQGQEIPYRPGTPTGEVANAPSSPVSYKLGSPSKRRHSLSKRSSLDFITRPLSRLSSRRLSNASPPPTGAANYPAISYPLGRSPSPPASSVRPVYPPQFLDLDEDSPTRSPQEGRAFTKTRPAPLPSSTAPVPELFNNTQSPPDTRFLNTQDNYAAPANLAPTTKHDSPRQAAFLKDEKHKPEKIVTVHPGAAVLGRYDLPPPSPPPMAPLPSVPPRSPLRQMDRDRSPLPDSGRPSPGLTRAASEMDSRFGLPRSPRFPPRSASDNDYGFGRSVSPGRLSPLPPRDQGAYMPPTPSVQQGRESPMPRGRVSPFPQQPVRPDLKPRMPIPRSREQEFAAGAWGAHAPAAVAGPSPDSDSDEEWEHGERYTGDDDRPAVRFDLASDRHLSRVSEGPSVADVDDYYFDERARESRYTESVYSRASTLLDTERSGEARSRLLGRVEAMYDGAGRERGAVPPVPRVPDALLKVPGGGLASRTGTPGRVAGNRF
ncbi:hypothetical protein HDZ31DRAFT_41994 [Schizophyllum fasciatum]